MASLKIIIVFGLFNWVIGSPAPFIEDDYDGGSDLVPSGIGQDPDFYDCYGKNRNRKEVPIKVYLYNGTDDGVPINDMWEDVEIPPCHRIRVVIHGFRQSRIEMMPIIQAYQEDEEFNTTVFVIDWSSVSRQRYKVVIALMMDFGFYLVPVIEKIVAATNQEAIKFHFIAFGVASHAICNAGRLMPGKLGHIVALDPTIAQMDEDSETQQGMMIGKDCAKFVRIIHTDGERYGLRRPMGHADFYVNGGFHQPGCGEDDVCGHLRPIGYMAEAILKARSFIAFRCASWYDLWYNGECRIVPSKHAMYVNEDGAKCPEEYEYGIFYLATNEKRPFWFYPPRYIYIARDVVHVSHTPGKYGSDWPIPTPCNSSISGPVMVENKDQRDRKIMKIEQEEPEVVVEQANERATFASDGYFWPHRAAIARNYG